ncbi:hypothetical protein ACQPZJ_22200 [Actinoplanes sp. CA-054009]
MPYVAFMTCGKYIAHDYAARGIGAYIRQHLSGRVAGGLGWEEHFSRTHIVPGRRLFFGIDPLFVGFPGIAAAALVFCSPPLVRSLTSTSVQDVLLAMLWLLGVALTCLSFRNLWLTQKVFVLSEWRRRKPRE